MMERVVGWLRRCNAPLSMVLVQVLVTGMMVLSKIVISRGMFIFALLSYRNTIGALFVAPFALFFERNKINLLGWRQLMWIFINAFLGQTIALALYYYGLRDTTPSYAADFLNMIPITTFALSLILRMERLEVSSKKGKVKILSAFICVGGAMVITLYKGKVLHINWPSFTHHVEANHKLAKDIRRHNIKRGTFFLVGSCLCYAFWFVSQVKLLKSFSAKYWPTTLTCAMASIQSFVIGIIIKRDTLTWSLRWDLQILVIFYTGILNTGVTFLLVQWVISQKGPTYPSMFNPLALIFTTIVESLFLRQDMTIGSVLGMFFIIGGLYGFLWGSKKNISTKNTDNLLLLHKNTNVVNNQVMSLPVVNPNPNFLNNAPSDVEEI
ncbi:hypothetical protein ZOSMA_361G00100 [Zostera marina]|uniref:WAT1-related protein n=1 Tax=Zostera marina TaxID=29655 RepID=A0A0K9P8Q2_ZOSMR|nr:hypothetical protein ZOSMA_361G00100 [Zostera marina]